MKRTEHDILEDEGYCYDAMRLEKKYLENSYPHPTTCLIVCCNVGSNKYQAIIIQHIEEH